MKATTTPTSVSTLLGGLLLAAHAVVAVPPPNKRDVDNRYPYLGPAVPVGDWVDPTINGNGKGFPRLVEPPAVKPAQKNPTNNINVVSVAYMPAGAIVHFQTPFGLDGAPTIVWGTSAERLNNTARGTSRTYGRTPSCSAIAAVTQCNEFFHDVQLAGLKPNTQYHYKIQASNGTTASPVWSFKTAREAGDATPFSFAVLNDMGYTNAHGTHKYMNQHIDDGMAFAWHGGDISYADDWYSGILPCDFSSWPVCYNGSESSLPGGPPYPDEYIDTPLPDGEIPNQGGPQGGDMSVLYESNWDLWQNWMNEVTLKVPYMVLPGNHEASCGEFDGGANLLTSYLNKNESNTASSESDLTYYSCPPSQRNFTAFQHRFTMPGEQTGGRGNFWYSFDYGLVHFLAFDSETDYPYSPEYPFIRDTDGQGDKPNKSQTYITDSGPFGYIDGNWTENESYEQYHWIKKDLAAVDRTKTPWVIAMAHRPMYSSQTSSALGNLRDGFQDLFLDAGVDMYLSGHIHWYERMWPLTRAGAVDNSSVGGKDLYYTNPGTSMTHIVNGMAGNIESHSTLGSDPLLGITNVLDQTHYGFSKLTVQSAEQLTWQFIMGKDGSIGDELTLRKKSNGTTAAKRGLW
ncbi:Metallo-dependent phosphatase-like protein [Xylariaceae sp. FL0804]|nr:Metallo-dependent phosphatase-like protein [Xylariaceae sp. FL0804]